MDNTLLIDEVIIQNNFLKKFIVLVILYFHYFYEMSTFVVSILKIEFTVLYDTSLYNKFLVDTFSISESI